MTWFFARPRLILECCRTVHNTCPSYLPPVGSRLWTTLSLMGIVTVYSTVRRLLDGLHPYVNTFASRIVMADVGVSVALCCLYKRKAESSKRIHLIMEHADGGNLCSYVKRRKRLDESEARRILRQLLEGVSTKTWCMRKRGKGCSEAEQDQACLCFSWICDRLCS